jgi:hypothetical protein
MAEVSNSFDDAILAMIQGQLSGVNTCIEGTITAYADGYASIVPNGKKRFADGDELDFPTVHNVPIVWPSFLGGAGGIKGPVFVGDGCLLVFAQQAADGSDDLRQHDMTDAYAIPFNKGSVAPDNDALTMYLGDASISIDIYGVVRITAPYGLIIDSHITAQNSITANGNLVMGNGANGTFSTPTGQTVTVSGGIITNIA